MRSVGLDLSARKICYCEVADGQVVARRTVRQLTELQQLLGQGTAPARVAFEACREGWITDSLLREWGHEPLMIDTTRVRQIGIAQHGRKNDRIDAEVIARAVERGGIPLAHVLSPHRQELRIELGNRRALVETRAGYVVMIRGILRARGEAIGRCEASNFGRMLEKAELKPETRMLVDPLASLLKPLAQQIARAEERIEVLCRQEPIVQYLATLSGVGLIVAAAFVAVIDDAQRFRSAHQVQAYLGLVPAEYSSVHRRIGAITKKGNGYMRALLVQSSWRVLQLKTDDPLKTWATQVAQRRGRRIAVVALARRLSGVLWAMWRDGRVYDPQLIGTGRCERPQDAQTVALALAAASRRRILRRRATAKLS